MTAFLSTMFVSRVLRTAWQLASMQPHLRMAEGHAHMCVRSSIGDQDMKRVAFPETQPGDSPGRSEEFWCMCRAHDNIKENICQAIPHGTNDCACRCGRYVRW